MKGDRSIVLTFARYYLPGYKAGGPIRAIANLVKTLGDGFDFRIVTSDRDCQDEAPYSAIANDGSWTAVGKARVLYLSPERCRLRDIARILRQTQYDVLYLNSFFDPTFTFKPLLARRLGLTRRVPCIVAPRGEFSAGALALKKRKKAAYLLAAQSAGLCRGLVWQASSEFEAADIARVFGPVAGSVRVAPDLPVCSASDAVDLYRRRSPGAPLRICFLSRISPMKNLDFALDVLRHVHVPVRFDIYGDVEDTEYWSTCRTRLADLPPHVDVQYCGSVPGSEVVTTMSGYDLFFLPTRGENFGHAIVESLAAGTPVLISNRTPWRGLSVKRIGWDLPLEEPQAFVACIDRMFDADEGASRSRRERARAFARQQQSNPASIADSRALFAGSMRAASATEQVRQ